MAIAAGGGAAREFQAVAICVTAAIVKVSGAIDAGPGITVADGDCPVVIAIDAAIGRSGGCRCVRLGGLELCHQYGFLGFAAGFIALAVIDSGLFVGELNGLVEVLVSANVEALALAGVIVWFLGLSDCPFG